MTEIWQIEATTLAAAIRAREISARQAAMAALARLDAVNPLINAVIAHRPEDVLAQADAVDEAIIRGVDPGLLAGVPVTVKVNIDQAGFATTNGTKLQENLIAASNSPVVDNFRRAGAVILGRTNTPAFSLRWFTSNLVHGATKNPRDPALTPGGSSGGAAASLAVGIGHIAHGTDIAGSIRYPAYASGVHGLRPSFGRIPAYNASLSERPLGAQLTSVSGPLARTIADLRLGLAVMAAPDARDPWWVPAPLTGPPAPRRVALCLRPDGLAIAPEVGAALLDAARRLETAGWTVEAVTDLPPVREAAELQTTFWIGDGFDGWDDLVRRDGDEGAQAVINGLRGKVAGVTPGDVMAAAVRRATVLRKWQVFLETYPVVLLPVSAQLPFPDNLDLRDFDLVWEAQLTLIGLAFLGLPALTVSTGLVGTTPVGVQIVAGRFREDLCLAAAEVIEAAGAPPSPIDPA